MPNFSAIRTSSANDPARIFCMTPLRWILTVNSVVPSFAAICLLSRPHNWLLRFHTLPALVNRQREAKDKGA
jgi:hypothetical protein